MKQSTAVASVLIADNLATVLASQKVKGIDPTSYACCLMLADMLDSVVRSEATHITIGLNKAKTSLLITVNFPGDVKAYVTGSSVGELVFNAAQQLCDVVVSGPLK